MNKRRSYFADRPVRTYDDARILRKGTETKMSYSMYFSARIPVTTDILYAQVLIR